ncbi:hypothetical protein [Lysobacter gummosus]
MCKAIRHARLAAICATSADRSPATAQLLAPQSAYLPQVLSVTIR